MACVDMNVNSATKCIHYALGVCFTKHTQEPGLKKKKKNEKLEKKTHQEANSTIKTVPQKFIPDLKCHTCCDEHDTSLVSAAATPTQILEYLFRLESGDICCSISATTWQTNFKGNHNYSCGSDSFSAECQKALGKFQAQFNPDRLFECKFFFYLNIYCGLVWFRYSAAMIPLMSLISTVAWASSSRERSSVVPVRAAWCSAEKLWARHTKTDRERR